MALLTAPFDQGNAQRGFISEAVQLASLLQRQRDNAQQQLQQQAEQAARAEEAKQKAQAAIVDGALSDLRRNFEFKKKEEYLNRDFAFKTREADRDYGIADRRVKLDEATFKADNEPFALPTGGGTAAPGATGSPRPGFSFGAGEDRTAGGSVFGMVPDGQGGWMNDPNDKTDASVPGFSATKGAWGASIKDPSLKGVALRPDELRSAGVDLADPSGFEVEVTKDGKAFRYPIVDKLGKAGRIDFTAAAYDELGGPKNRGGGIIEGINYKIVPKGQASAAPSAVDSYISEMERARSMGIPVRRKDVAQGVARVATAGGTATARAEARSAAPARVKANMQDADGNLYTQFVNGGWKDGVAPEPGTKVFTIAAPGKPVGPALEYHEDGTVTTRTGRVFHYNDAGNLEPAHVPKGKTVKYTMQGSDGDVHTQFNDGTWDTDDGLAPEGVALTKMPGATEERRLELRTEGQKIAEKQRTVSSLQSDRNHFDSEASKAQKAADKLAESLNEKPVSWPWEKDGTWFKWLDPKVKKSTMKITADAAKQLIAENRERESKLAEHSKNAAEFSRKSDAAQAKIDEFISKSDAPAEAPKGEAPPAQPTQTAAPAAKETRPIYKDKGGNRAYKNPDGTFEPITNGI